MNKCHCMAQPRRMLMHFVRAIDRLEIIRCISRPVAEKMHHAYDPLITSPIMPLTNLTHAPLGKELKYNAPLTRRYLNKRRVTKKECNVLAPTWQRQTRYSVRRNIDPSCVLFTSPAAPSGNFQNASLTTNPFLLPTIMDFNGSPRTSKQSSRVFARAFPFQPGNPRVK